MCFVDMTDIKNNLSILSMIKLFSYYSDLFSYIICNHKILVSIKLFSYDSD